MKDELKKTAKIAGAIGRVTFLEIVRDKVLYNIVLCSALLLAIGVLASRLAIFKEERVVLDFGVSAVLLSSLAIAILNGAALLGREFERRTVLVTLSRPISRLQFVLGKYAGLGLVLALNWLLLSCCLLVILVFTAQGWPSSAGPTFFIALFLALIESLLVGALAILFSSFSTTSLSVIFTVGVCLVGSNISQLRWVATRVSGAEAALLNGAAALFPNLEYFNLGFKVTYGLPVTPLFVLTAVAYAMVIVAAALLLSGWCLRRRES